MIEIDALEFISEGIINEWVSEGLAFLYID